MIRRFLHWLVCGHKSSRAITSSALAVGQLVSVADDDGRFAVMKVLAIDQQGVHVRLYVQRFASRPTRKESAELKLNTAPFGPEFGNPLSVGHLPLSFASFAAWQPKPICQSEIAEEELDGYRMWEEAKGGYF